MDTQASEHTKKQQNPPYVGWPSYRGMLSGFKEHVLPSRIDRSVLGNFSGIVGTQLLATLKFLGQIDAAGKPTEHLERAVNAIGTEEWVSELTAQLRRAYAPVFSLNLQTASPNQFTETFRGAYPCEGDTLRKSMTFFLNAAREAQIPVSMFIMKNKKPRSGNGVKKLKAAKQASAKAEDNPDPIKTREQTPPAQPAQDDFRQQLLSKFPAFDPAWPDNIKADWFKGFEQFMAMAQKQ
ncbi:DUF5343 domain-containing protein [Mesorhizobium sp. B2-3-5]|uniref:DUF5343 domain-containing protein n=1 Tax=Mesorhizobium sp. B2-3-5 TaxID=2589958 RepID=UPI00112B96A2|nr:DUF5343 domain-containing protein [Mesorhizobium sp. B2-3-5]TPM27177.1 hypothetical protein FJ958_18590 [Mesorhizobium sp. B2-3-5]